MLIAGRTNEQHRNDNKELISEKQQQHRQDHLLEVRRREKENKDKHREAVRERARNCYQQHREDILDKIKERCMCECGIEVNKSHIARHRATQKHIQLMGGSSSSD